MKILIIGKSPLPMKKAPDFTYRKPFPIRY